MSVRIDPVVLHVRGYDDGVDIRGCLADMKAPYRFHCLVVVLDNGDARIQGLDAGITVNDYRDIKRKLTALGIKRVNWRHGDKQKWVVLNGATIDD